jgi:hypothetical protein
VERDDGRQALGSPFSHQLLSSSGKGLLGRLKYEADPTIEFEPGCHQGQSGANGGMNVVAARVHDARNFGAMYQSFWFLNGQCIEITSKADQPLALSHLDHEPGARAPGPGFQSGGPKARFDQFGGGHLAIRQFRTAMQLTTQLDYLGKELGDRSPNVTEVGGSHVPGRLAQGSILEE